MSLICIMLKKTLIYHVNQHQVQLRSILIFSIRQHLKALHLSQVQLHSNAQRSYSQKQYTHGVCHVHCANSSLLNKAVMNAIMTGSSFFLILKVSLVLSTKNRHIRLLHLTDSFSNCINHIILCRNNISSVFFCFWSVYMSKYIQEFSTISFILRVIIHFMVRKTNAPL